MVQSVYTKRLFFIMMVLLFMPASARKGRERSLENGDAPTVSSASQRRHAADSISSAISRPAGEKRNGSRGKRGGPSSDMSLKAGGPPKGRRGGGGPPTFRMMSVAHPVTLELLALKHRSTVQKLQKLNPELRSLAPGDTLRMKRLTLPFRRIRESYFVQQGDSWSSVAQKLAVKEAKLRKANRTLISGELKAGQTLLLPDPPDWRWLWIVALFTVLIVGIVTVKKLVFKA